MDNYQTSKPNQDIDPATILPLEAYRLLVAFVASRPIAFVVR